MILKIVGGFVAVFFLILAIVITTQPDTFRVERKITIAAPASAVFAHISDFHEWAKWSPWEKMDTDLKKTFSGPRAGVGSVYSWVGKKTGEGTMTIQEVSPQRTAIQLELTKPMAATNLAEFIATPAGNGVTLSWVMSGRNTAMGKVFGMVMSMDKMIGNDFERGLADLKAISESDATRMPASAP